MPTQLRLHLCTAACLASLLPLGARLSFLQVLKARTLSLRAEHETARQTLEIVPRGRILDREGHVLAESMPSWSSTLDVSQVRDSGALARAICAALGPGCDSRGLKRKMALKRSIWLKRKMTPDEVANLKSLNLPGVAFQSDETRTYPNGDLARAILGAVGSEGKGSAALEQSLEKTLSGNRRLIRLTQDGAGRAILQEEGETPAPESVKLTIDRTMQFFAESELKEAVLKHRARGGSLLVQDPKSGDILAMAVYPSEALHNSAVQDVYEPGSTFKIVMALAALEKNLLPPSERIDCEFGRWQVAPSLTIKDHEPMGPSTLSEILIRSSNIGSAKIALRLSASEFQRFCRTLGFGYKTGIALPGESAGLLKPIVEQDKIRLANAAFGQGLAVTALQLVNAYSAVANGGMLLEPRLVLAVGESPTSEAVRVRQVARPETIARLREMLEAVVEHGTGVLAQVPGYRVAGKTGTAQKIDPETGRYSATDYISSFAGYAPARDPRFTILVVIDSPKGQYYASDVAAPVFARLCRRLLALRGLPPDLPFRSPPAVSALPRPSILQSP